MLLGLQDAIFVCASCSGAAVSHAVCLAAAARTVVDLKVGPVAAGSTVDGTALGHPANSNLEHMWSEWPCPDLFTQLVLVAEFLSTRTTGQQPSPQLPRIHGTVYCMWRFVVSCHAYSQTCLDSVPHGFAYVVDICM